MIHSETLPPAAAQAPQLDSLFDMLVAGGPFMVPIGLCSVVALGCTLERALRLRRSALGLGSFEGALVDAVRAGGAARGLELCAARPSPLARVLHASLANWSAPFLEREKLVEDAGWRETSRLSLRLRALVAVAMIAPLLGLLGTVWGMILCFQEIGLREGLGRPEQLGGGIAQALITTWAGLVIAIPSQAAYYWLKGKVERFSRAAEDLHEQVRADLSSAGGAP